MVQVGHTLKKKFRTPANSVPVFGYHPLYAISCRVCKTPTIARYLDYDLSGHFPFSQAFAAKKKPTPY